MRSLILALAFAAPVCAVAATPTYSNPLNRMHHQDPQLVAMTFVNFTGQDRELQIGDQYYKIPCVSMIHVYAPVGSPVFVFSQTNSKVNGQELMRVSATDANKSVHLL